MFREGLIQYIVISQLMGGETWGELSTLVEGPYGVQIEDNSTVQLDSGAILFAYEYEEVEGGYSHLEQLISTDNGETWEAIDDAIWNDVAGSDNEPGGYLRFSDDEIWFLAATDEDAVGGSYPGAKIKRKVSTDGGLTWGSKTTLLNFTDHISMGGLILSNGSIGLLSWRYSAASQNLYIINKEDAELGNNNFVLENSGAFANYGDLSISAEENPGYLTIDGSGTFNLVVEYGKSCGWAGRVLRSSNTLDFNQSYAVESSINISSFNIAGETNTYGVNLGISLGYDRDNSLHSQWAIYGNGDQLIQFYQEVVNSFSQIGTGVTKNFTTGTHTLKLIYDSQALTFDVDGTQKTGTTALGETDLYVSLYTGARNVGDSIDNRFDWVFVRNYSHPEPQISIDSEATFITGQVTLTGGSADVRDVVLNLSGEANSTANPDADGNYSFTELEVNYNYTVIPSLTDYHFFPSSRSYSPLNSDQTSQNFEGLYKHYDGDNNGIPDWIERTEFTSNDGDNEQKIFTNCFIATACYGTPMAGEVKMLSEFRDKHLLTNPIGKVFVNTYYKISPHIAEFIGEHPVLKKVVRSTLNPIIWMSEKSTE